MTDNTEKNEKGVSIGSFLSLPIGERIFWALLALIGVGLLGILVSLVKIVVVLAILAAK